MLHLVKLDQVREYEIKTVEVIPFLWNGEKSHTRYESIILYKGMGECDLHKAYICTVTKPEALLAHNHLLHEVVNKIARLTFSTVN